MKKIIIASLLIAVPLIILASSRRNFQVVDVYVCGPNIEMASVNAKARVSRNELISVSHCRCQGVGEDMAENVKNKKSCEGVDRQVYTCSCLGLNRY